MSKFIRTQVFLGLLLTSLFSQAQSFTISGYIEDAATGEKLIGANIFDAKTDKGTSTNTYGFYSLTLPKDSVYLVVTYIGYAKKIYALDLTKDLSLNLLLSEGETLETVEITADVANRIEERVQMSQVEIPISQIKSLPAFLGEVDILKTLQLLPGVQSGNEGTSGIYVRGGSPDQNLILLDGVPVYNVSHLFGFFSVFNADAIKNVTLTKGGFPARFGGRLSSVLEINMKEGNLNEYHGEGSIGLISSKFTFEGPIEKGVSSFIVSGRRTYLDVLAKPFIAARNLKNPEDQVDPGYYFYDLNAKVNRKFGEKDRVFWSFYGGNDDFRAGFKDKDSTSTYEEKVGLQWGNVTSALRWNHQFSSKLFANFATTYTRYNFDIGIESTETYHDQGDSIDLIVAKYLSKIEDWGAKVDFDYVLNPEHYIRFGASTTHHNFTPGATQWQLDEIDSTPFDTLINTQAKAAWESSIYVEDDMTLFKSLKINAGLHASIFSVDGINYTSLQPRIGLNYRLPGNIALKASYAQMTQFIHLLASGGLGLPTDLWVPTTKNILPEQSWQAAFGVAKTFKDAFEVSIEGYYKEMKNLVSYLEGASFLDDSPISGVEQSWENKVTQGTGEAYGVEFFVQKKKGNTTGWVGYTLSWTNRQFDLVNNGIKFPFKYDRRHDVSLVFMQKLSERISLSAAWVYGTGNAVTIPTNKYWATIPRDLGNISNSLYVRTIEGATSKNSDRMRAYHRLDFAIEFHKKKKRYDQTWVIGTYNTYNRANPFFIQIVEEWEFNGATQTRVAKLRQFSLFPLVPSVAWRFKF